MTGTVESCEDVFITRKASVVINYEGKDLRFYVLYEEDLNAKTIEPIEVGAEFEDDEYSQLIIARLFDCTVRTVTSWYEGQAVCKG